MESTDTAASRERVLADHPAPKPPPFAQRLENLLDGRLGTLTLTENRSRILSAKALADGKLAVRIHRCFVSASDQILATTAAFLSGDLDGKERRRALAIIRQHFELEVTQEHESKPARLPTLHPIGCRFDLREVRDRINRDYFDGQLNVHITWGREGSRRHQRSIRLGSYQARNSLVRLHRALDRPWVPAYVIESIVYHEMLHADIPPEISGSRRTIHTREFKRRERLFPHYERSEAWLKKNLDRLLRGGRRLKC